MNNCTIERIHQQIKFEYNKLDSNFKADIPEAFMDDLVYQAILDYIDIFYSDTNLNKYGFEQVQNRLDMLQPFVTDYDFTLPTPILKSNIYYYTFDLPKDYLHNTRLFASTSCGIVTVDLDQHDDLSYKLRYLEPNPKWNYLLATISGDKLTVYSTETLLSVEGNYIKIPVKPFSGGYDTLEYINGDRSYPNQNSNKIQPELSQSICNKIVRIATINLSDILTDYNHSQIYQRKLLNTN